MAIRPTKRQAFRQVLSKAREAEKGRWLNKGFEVGLWLVASAGIGAITGNYAGFWAGLLTGAGGLLLMFVARGGWFFFDGWHAIYCEQQEEIASLRATKSIPASQEAVQQIMENLAFHGEQLGCKLLDSAAYIQWNIDVEAFVRCALVDAWQHGFFVTINALSPAPSLISKGTQIDNAAAIKTLQRAAWLTKYAEMLRPIDVLSGCTQEKLEQWVNWKPVATDTQGGNAPADLLITNCSTIAKAKTLATPVYVRRIIKNFAFVGTRIACEQDKSQCSDWRY